MTILHFVRVALCCLAGLPIYAQTTSTSFQTGGTVTTKTLNGTFSWSGTGNLSTSNNSRASASVLLGLFAVAYSDYIVVKNFGFSIPPYASITGIEVQIEKRASGLGVGSSVRDNIVRLLRADTLTGNNLATAGNWTGSDQTATHGDASTNWGTSWTAAEINSPGFGVAFSSRIATGAVGLTLGSELDLVQIRVHYLDIVLPIHILSFQGKSVEGHAQLEWIVESNEDGPIWVERQKPGFEWEKLAEWRLAEESVVGNRQRWTDPDFVSAACYRLHFKTAAGTDQYSSVLYIKGNDLAATQVYPNPARDLIRIETSLAFKRVSLYDMMGRLKARRIFEIASNIQNWQLPNLPVGDYLLVIGDEGPETASRLQIRR